MSIRRRRPGPGAISWSAIATPIRCAAPRIFPRPRPGKSAAGATDFPARRSRAKRHTQTNHVILRRPQRGRLEGRRPGRLILRGSLRSHLRMTDWGSVEQIRRVIDVSALNRQHLELGDDAAIGGEAAGLAAGGKHAVARHHDRTGIAPERLADIARQLNAAEPLCNIAISYYLARRVAES